MVLTREITVFCYILIAVLGACFGSFLNCLAWRIVNNESIMKGRSHCDYCNHVLKPLDLIPIISFIIFGGKCRYCGQKLSVRHLLAEIVSAFVFVSAFYKYGVSLQLCEYLILAIVLLGCSFADLEGYIIPDSLILTAVLGKLIFIVLSEDKLNAFTEAIIGGFSVAIALLIIVLVFEKITGKVAMGGGDIKLIFVIGIFVGWKLNILCLIISCIVGIISGLIINIGKKTNELFPWGPSIAFSGWITVLFGQAILEWYIGLFV